MKRFGSLRNVIPLVTALIFSLLSGCSEPDGATTGGASAASATLPAARALQAPQQLPQPPETLASFAPPLDSDLPGLATDAGNPATVAGGEIAQVGTLQAGDSTTAAPPAQIELSQQPTGLASLTSANAHQREPLFVGWPQPRLAIMITGRQYGYMEPCGCSGLENQNGGLVRRSTLIKQLREKGWNVLPVDAGNQVRRFGRQAELKFQFTIESLRQMGYRAIGFGPDDLRLPAAELVGLIDAETFVCANAKIFGDSSFTAPCRVFTDGGKKVGMTMVLGDRNVQMVNNSEVTFESAEASLKQVWPQLEQAKCDLYVLVAHTSIEESQQLARQFPQFQVVITTGGAGEPAREPESIEGTKSLLIQVGTKGMFAGVLGLFDDAARPLRYQRVPLDSRFPDSPQMLQLMAEYQDQLKTHGFEGLGITPQPMQGERKFVGSQLCQECHEKEYTIWKEGLHGHVAKHSHAYATLEHPPNSRGSIPRNHDPECLSCHVVGWNPQKYFPYKSGFLSLEQTPELTDVGCENCHGPGSQHIAAENGDLDVDDDGIDQLREQMWIALKDAEKKCLECHDLDNSPAFQEPGAFETYWSKIEH